MIFTIPAGVTVLREGEVNMDLYKLMGGNCEVYTGYGTERESILGILSRGAYFGETGFFSQKPSIYTVVTYSDVVVERIVIAEFERYVRDHYKDIFSLMQNMTNTMYNLKFNMDLMVRETENKNNANNLNDHYLREQLKRYNLLGMKSISFFTSNT